MGRNDNMAERAVAYRLYLTLVGAHSDVVDALCESGLPLIDATRHQCALALWGLAKRARRCFEGEANERPGV